MIAFLQPTETVFKVTISLNKSTEYILTLSIRIMTSYTVAMEILFIIQIGSILFREDSRC